MTDEQQERQLLKLVNKARALAELSSQASLVIPLAIPEEPLPSSIRLDTSSPWHVSALFAATIESTTLYTRIKTTDRINSSNLGHITDLLNVFGRQTIANIEMSPIKPPNPTRNGTNDIANLTNSRGELLSSLHDNSIDDESESGSQKGTTSLEVDLSSPQDQRLESGIRGSRKRYVFSQVQTYRGLKIERAAADDNDDITNGHLGIKRRPKIHK